MKKMKIQDVRFQFTFFQKETEAPLGNMLSDIGHLFLSKIKYQYEIENTNVLRFSCRNCDENNFIEKLYSLGDGEIDNIGTATFNISEKYFLSLDDEQKRLFLLDTIYKSFKDYAYHFNQKIDLLDEAYNKVLKDGFYTNETGFVSTSNKLYKCWVEKLLNFKNSDYRLAFEDTKMQSIEYYYLGNKETPIIKPNSDVITLLTTPQSFYVEGWKKDEFRLRWGEYGNELYTFDKFTKELKMQINKVELPDFLK
ncbi:hypothetical protein [Flavobacterium sp. UBA4854]|uniref:hypothetical protein n=2 Tax=Flavobacterium TaxID=237 RepID=UPI002580619D|nr:hypothetical protein [Flavobacterium sp. UBA4854]